MFLPILSEKYSLFQQRSYVVDRLPSLRLGKDRNKLLNDRVFQSLSKEYEKEIKPRSSPLPIKVGKQASGWKSVTGATGGVVILSTMSILMTPGVFIVHLGINIGRGDRFSSAAAQASNKARTRRVPYKNIHFNIRTLSKRRTILFQTNMGNHKTARRAKKMATDSIRPTKALDVLESFSLNMERQIAEQAAKGIMRVIL